MCDCIKYKDFFAADEINHIQLLKEELSLNETSRFVTPEQEKEIISLYTDKNNPLNAAQIAKLFNVNRGPIDRILVRNGVTIRDRKKLTPEQEKEIVSLYTDKNNPLSALQIAKLFNVSRGPIDRILVSNGVTIRDKKKLTSEQEKEIVSLYTDTKNPLNIVQIASRFNVSEGTISNILVRNGVTIRDNKKLTPEQEKEIVSIYTDTKNPQNTMQIAKLFNVNYGTIVNILVRNGVTIRDKSTSKMLLGIIPNGMTPTDYEIYKKIKFSTRRDRHYYIRLYRIDKKQCVVCGNPAIPIKNPNGTYQMLCKKHYEQNLYANTNKKRKRKNDAVLYKGGKCNRCGYNKSNAALDFHHVDRTQKDKNWLSLRLKPLEQLKNELDKCELLCKNCHAVVDKEGVSRQSRFAKQKKLACLEYKKTKDCTKCGLAKDRRALSFHHIRPSEKDKKFKTYLAWPEWSGWQPGQELPDRIKKEFDKCVVLCKNCHAEEHWDSATDDVTDEYYKEIPEEECTDDNCKHSH